MEAKINSKSIVLGICVMLFSIYILISFKTKLDEYNEMEIPKGYIVECEKTYYTDYNEFICITDSMGYSYHYHYEEYDPSNEYEIHFTYSKIKPLKILFFGFVHTEEHKIVKVGD